VCRAVPKTPTSIYLANGYKTANIPLVGGSPHERYLLRHPWLSGLTTAPDVGLNPPQPAPRI
jgi:regulator of PEP synthase PpsR (kinase-PPPase family)